MTNKLSLSLSLVFGLLSTVTLAQNAIQAAMVDNADVFMYYDLQGLNDSAWKKAVDSSQTPEEKAAAEEQFALFTDATGLEADDISAIAMSMDIDGIDFTSQDPSQLETASIVMAVESKKELTLEQMKSALDTVSESTEGPKPTIELTEVEGIPVLQLTGTATPGGMDKAYAALSKDGKTAIISFNVSSLQGALARLATTTPAVISEEMAQASASVEDQQMGLTVILPEAVKQMIQQGVQASTAQGGMAGAMLMPFATTESLQVSMKADEDLSLGVSLNLGVPANAQQAAGMIQSMLPMMMMGLQGQAGPEAMNLMNKIEISAEEKNVMLKISLTAEESNMIFSTAAPALNME